MTKTPVQKEARVIAKMRVYIKVIFWVLIALMLVINHKFLLGLF